MNVSFTQLVSENIVRRSKVPPDQAPVCDLAIADPALRNNPFTTSHISSSGKVGTFGVACTPKTTKALYPKRLALVDVADGDIQGASERTPASRSSKEICCGTGRGTAVLSFPQSNRFTMKTGLDRKPKVRKR